LLLLGMLFVLEAVAAHFPLEIGPKYNVNAVTAVDFAALLLFGPPVAMVLASAGLGVGLIAIRVRTHLQGRTRRSWRSIVFGMSQTMITTAAGGAVYFAVLPHQVPAPQERLENVWAIPVAALAMYVTSSWLVATIAGIQRGASPLELWLSVRKREVLHEAGLSLLGLVTARTAQNDPWIPLVMLLPGAIIYLSTKRNVQLVEQTIGAVEALADVVDRRDHYTFEHSKRVAEYARRIARAMKLPADDVEQIRLAARVHDLGKIGVPNTVLHKDGALTDEEWAVMRSHPDMGYEILTKFPEYKRGRELVRSHHERYDGLGYPQGLDDRHLLLGAQIIAVADTLDAMTSDRPYRTGLGATIALAALRDGRGTQYHPDVVDTLERLMASDPEAFLLVRRGADHAATPTPMAAPELASALPSITVPVSPARVAVPTSETTREMVRLSA
jgi:putative nucleotidyltransferase with HDIG domain